MCINYYLLYASFFIIEIIITEYYTVLLAILMYKIPG